LQNRDIGNQTDSLLYTNTGEIIASNQPEITQTVLPEAPPLELSDAQRALIEKNSLIMRKYKTAMIFLCQHGLINFEDGS